MKEGRIPLRTDGDLGRLTTRRENGCLTSHILNSRGVSSRSGEVVCGLGKRETYGFRRKLGIKEWNWWRTNRRVFPLRGTRRDLPVATMGDISGLDPTVVWLG